MKEHFYHSGFLLYYLLITPYLRNDRSPPSTINMCQLYILYNDISRPRDRKLQIFINITINDITTNRLNQWI